MHSPSLVHLTIGALTHIIVMTPTICAFTIICASHHWCTCSHHSYDTNQLCNHHNWCISPLVHMLTSYLRLHPVVHSPSLVHLTIGAHAHIRVTTPTSGAFTIIGASHHWCTYSHHSYDITIGAHAHIIVMTPTSGAITIIGASHHWCTCSHHSYDTTQWCNHHNWCISPLVHMLTL